MRRNPFIFLLVATLFVANNALAFKVAVVDVETLVKAHPNTKSDKALIEEKLADYEQDRDEIEGRVRNLQVAYEKAVAEAKNPALSDRARRDKAAAADASSKELSMAKRKAVDAVRAMQKSLTEDEVRMFNRTMKEIAGVVKEYAEREGFELVLDASGKVAGARGMVAMPNVVYFKDSIDISDEIMILTGGKLPVEEPVAE